MTRIFRIGGMTCAACSRAVERATGKLTGMQSAAVNLATEKLTVTYDESKLSEQDIIGAVVKAGYTAELETEKAKKTVEKRKSDELSKTRKRLVFSAILTVPLLYVSMGHMIGLPLPQFISPDTNPLWFALTQLILTLPIVIMGYRFYTIGFSSLFRGHPNMDSLIAVGTSSALIYGIYATINIALGKVHFAHELYFESAAVIITLITLGKYLEAVSKGKTGEAIKKLISLRPDTANVIRDGKEVTVPTESVVVGDIIIVRPGEKLSVDGVVTEGHTAVDEAMLTGESIPVEKTIGDEVTGSSINKNGLIKYRATRVGDDTALAKIVRFVEEAQGSKAPIAKLADIIAGYFVPTVIVLAVISALGWLLLGEGTEFALTIFISVLVIACPCALGLATPTAIMVGTGKGAENGILIRNGEVLESAHKINTIVFDKTGTVTEGKPSVTDILTFGDISKSELLSLAATGEAGSEHPLAEAIVQHAKLNNIAFKELSDFTSHTGKGVSFVADEKKILIGNTHFMSENSVDTKSFLEASDMLAVQGKTPTLVSADGIPLGIIAVADKVKEGSKEAVKRLHSLGIKTVMITGDNAKTAAATAKEVGIDEVLAEVLPNEKAERIKELQDGGKIVAMAGDGINDAPALAQADVGIAIGSGTDVAIEAADIVLMKSDLRDVPTAVELSRRTIRNIKQNLGWAFGYNIIGIPIAMGVLHLFGGPLLNPMIAGAAMSLSSVSVVTNALRLKGFKAKEYKGEITVKKTVSVGGMSCMHCVKHVKDALLEVKGVVSAEVSLEENKAVVETNGEVGDEALKSAIEEAGYDVNLIS